MLKLKKLQERRRKVSSKEKRKRKTGML